jgi:hypothetical protein
MRRSYADARIDVSECSTTPQIVVRSSGVHARRLLSYDVADGCRSAPVVLAHRGLLSAGQDVVGGVQLQLCSRTARLPPRLDMTASSGQLQLCSRMACPSCCRIVSARSAPVVFAHVGVSSLRGVGRDGGSAPVVLAHRGLLPAGRDVVGGVQLQLCSRMAASPLFVVSAATAPQDQLCSRTACVLPACRGGVGSFSSSCARASRRLLSSWCRLRQLSGPVVLAHGGASSLRGVGCDGVRSAPVVLAHRGLLSAGQEGVGGGQLQLCSRMAASPLRVVSAATSRQDQLCSRTADPLRYVSGVGAGGSAAAVRRQESGAVRGARGACPFRGVVTTAPQRRARRGRCVRPVASRGGPGHRHLRQEEHRQHR